MPSARLLPAITLLVLVLVGMLWVVQAAQVATRNSQPATPWCIVPSADPSKDYNELHAVAARSPQDAWAVGTFGTEQYALTLIEHWDGKQWTHVSSPSTTDYSNHLHAVAAISPNDAWAVGGYHRGTDFWQTLMLHWDGDQWSLVPSPNPAPISILYGIAAVSPNDAWAVGEYSQGSKGRGSQTLTMHWDGKQWSIVPSPNTAQNSTLNAVAALAGDDVWAVGSYDDKSGTISRPLILHWDGKEWKAIENNGAGILWAISAISPKDIWAVGNNGPQTLTMHWDGANWLPVGSPNPSPGTNSLTGVAAISPDDVWAVGSQNSGGAGRTLTMHWDGRQWEAAQSQNAGTYLDTLTAVAATGPNNIWAAGSDIADPAGTNKTLVQRPCK